MLDSPSPDSDHVDGRLARSQRTRGAIVDALIELLEGGLVQPTVEDIAGRAGVAPRTVFQHYADREALFAAVSERRQPRLEVLLGRLPVDGGLEERIDALVDQRTRVYEWIAPVRRAALLMEPFSAAAHIAVEGLRMTKRAQAVRIFATEIDAWEPVARPALRAAIGVAASWSSWDALRTQQRLGAEQAADALRCTLLGLLADP